MLKKFKTIFVYTIPVLAGYIFLGIAFGLLIRTNGYPTWYGVIMSIIMFTGALEFAAIPMIAQPFEPIGSFVFGLLLCARHLFYGIPMLKKYKDTGMAKPFLIFGLTDETFSILSTVDCPDGIKPKTFYVVLTFLNYLYWNIGTLIGGIVGEFVGDKARGLDFAITALFIVLFVEQLKDKQGLLSGFTGLIATAAILMMFGSSKMVIISMIVIIVVLLAGKKAISHE